MRQRSLIKRWRAIVGVVVVACFLAGCGQGSKSYKSFIPKQEAARGALEKALDAWQSEKPHGAVDKGPPGIEVVDTDWRSGRKLGSYQILKEEPGEGPRWFDVQLQLKNPAAEKTVRYVVLGKDPLWVYSEEEYKRLSGL